ncbi:hypothetical protein CISIN_1g041752mg, partial [Citrus sinensis]
LSSAKAEDSSYKAAHDEGTEKKTLRARPWGKWAAETRDRYKGICIWLGIFNITKEAARAYAEAAKHIRSNKA